MEIERSIVINAPRERVWRALTRAEELSKWFEVAINGVVAPGAVLRMDYQGYPFDVRIVEMDAPSRFVWKWVPGMVDYPVDMDKEPLTTVTFTLEEEGAGTRVTVKETGFDRIALTRRAKAYEENTEGWKIQMQRLADYAGKAA